MISPEYIEENKRLHQEIADYGACGARNAEQVYALINLFRPKKILDFGCGKGSLKPAVEALMYKRRSALPQTGRFTDRIRRKSISPIADYPRWSEYDPAIEGKDRFPVEGLFDLVVATDVLEHIEPDQLEGVLETIRGCTAHAFFCTIGVTPSTRRLSDGRDAHLIIEREQWWRQELHANVFETVVTLPSSRSGVITLLAM